MAVSPSPPALDPGQVAEESRRWAGPLIETLGGGFVALYLYGSAVEAEWDPKRSDLNLLLLAESLPSSTVRAVAEAWPRTPGPLGARANLVAVTAEQMARAVDTFALEIREIQTRGRLLAGRDLMAELKVPPDSLRHHLERELRLVTTSLRRVYFEARDRRGTLAAAMAESVGTVVACARGLGHLRGRPVPASGAAALNEAAEWCGVEPRAWLEAWRLRHEPDPPASAEAVFLDYLDATAAFMRRVDGFEES